MGEIMDEHYENEMRLQAALADNMKRPLTQQPEMTSLREIKAGIMNIPAAQDRIWQGQAAVEKNVLVAIAELRKDQGEINLYKQRLATSEACRNNLAIALETERTKHKNRASRKTNKVRGGPKRAPRKPRHKRKK